MIEVGEYVRTKKDGICKLLNIENDYMWCGYVDKPFWLRKDNIVKHSKNIIDLIEVGDYVNGEKIKRINDYGDFKRADFNLDYDDCDAVYEDDIKSIVTKEQFASMEYKIKEKAYE